MRRGMNFVSIGGEGGGRGGTGGGGVQDQGGGVTGRGVGGLILIAEINHIVETEKLSCY